MIWSELKIFILYSKSKQITFCGKKSWIHRKIGENMWWADHLPIIMRKVNWLEFANCGHRKLNKTFYLETKDVVRLFIILTKDFEIDQSYTKYQVL